MFAAGVVMAVIAAATPAHSHNAYWYKEDFIYGNNPICTRGRVQQWHHKHDVLTIAGEGTSGRGCWYYKNAAFGQAQHYYKQRHSGGAPEFCGAEGWHWSPDAGSPSMARFYNYDIWSHFGCNYGPNVWVVIYIDSWQYARYNGNWYGGAWQPATHHCHCP